MPDRTINFGDDAADARYRIQDTSSTGGDFVLAEDLDGGTVLLEYDYSASEWVSRGPVNLNGNDITNAGSITADTLDANSILRGDRGRDVLLDSYASLDRSTQFDYTFNVDVNYDVFDLSIGLAAGEDPAGTVEMTVSGLTDPKYNYTLKNRSTETDTDGDTKFVLLDGRFAAGRLSVWDSDVAFDTSAPKGNNSAFVETNIATNKEADKLIQGEYTVGKVTPISSITITSDSDNFAGRVGVFGRDIN